MKKIDVSAVSKYRILRRESRSRSASTLSIPWALERGSRRVDCSICKKGKECCGLGAWVDLEEAKEILSLGLKGDFYHLERDKDFPSGYKVGTSYEDDPCSFLTPDGLCAIHKVDYSLKPAYCKEFPYEKGKLSDFADVLCAEVKPRIKKRNDLRKRRI